MPSLAHGGDTLRSVDLRRRARADRPTASSSAPTTTVFDYDAIVKSGALIVDTRNALKSHTGASIFRL